jgi:hypothetical protein
LVLNLDLEAAKSLARHYEQHAFVWVVSSGLPALIDPQKPRKNQYLGNTPSHAFETKPCPFLTNSLTV